MPRTPLPSRYRDARDGTVPFRLPDGTLAQIVCQVHGPQPMRFRNLTDQWDCRGWDGEGCAAVLTAETVMAQHAACPGQDLLNVLSDHATARQVPDRLPPGAVPDDLDPIVRRLVYGPHPPGRSTFLEWQPQLAQPMPVSFDAYAKAWHQQHGGAPASEAQWGWNTPDWAARWRQ